MRTAFRSARKNLGRRGAALLLLGSGAALYGLGFLLDPSRTPRNLQTIAEWGGLRAWSWLWICCGLFTAASAWTRTGRDWLGFFSATIPPLVWSASTLWGAVEHGHVRNYTLSAWYLVGHVGITLWAASVPEYALPDKKGISE